MAQWNANTVPKCKEKTCSDEVLATIERKSGHRYVIKAVYIPYHHCTVEDMGWSMCDGVPDDWEYVEEQDSWWIPQGWYEVADNFEEYEYAAVQDKVIAWMKLPKPYAPKIKNFADMGKEAE